MGAAKKLEETRDKREAESGLSSPDITRHYVEFRNILLARRNELIEHTDAERAELSNQMLDSPGDVGDVSVVDTSADYFLKLADNDRHELMEIRDAFFRMQRGTYGVCETCEIDIPIERLRRVPYARRCIDCQSLAESRARTTRPQPTPKL